MTTKRTRKDGSLIDVELLAVPVIVSNEIVGFIAGQRSTRMGCEGELQWMFVLPERQREGVGAALLAPMAEWFVQQDSRHVIIDAPPENGFRAFYLKYGATPFDEYWLHWEDIEAARLYGRTTG